VEDWQCGVLGRVFNNRGFRDLLKQKNLGKRGKFLGPRQKLTVFETRKNGKSEET